MVQHLFEIHRFPVTLKINLRRTICEKAVKT